MNEKSMTGESDGGKVDTYQSRMNPYSSSRSKENEDVTPGALYHKTGPP